MTDGCYLFHAIDRPGTGELRGAVREAHRAFIRRQDPDCTCVLGGPLLDEAGAMIGTALVFEAGSAAAVAAFMADDPYVRGGLFEHVEIRRWRIGLGAIVSASAV